MGILGRNWFITFLLESEQGRAYICALLGACAVFAVALIVMARWRASARNELEDLEQQLLPLHTYPFSKQGDLEVYGEGLRIIRNGTCVSPMFSSIWSVDDLGEKTDRVIRVKWMTAGGPVTTDVHCGCVDRPSTDKLKDIMMHYGKG